MDKELALFKEELIRLINGIPEPELATIKSVFQFPPFINKGYKGVQEFFDKKGNKISYTLFLDERANHCLLRFIFMHNQENMFNEIQFFADKSSITDARINVTFNKAIEDEFQNNLPKSKRGKTVAWWKTPGEVKDLLN